MCRIILYRFVSSLLSQYRTELMGVATLLIVFFHLTFRIGHNVLWYVSTHAMIGVEMFFFLSGLGLCFSISHDYNVWHFYLKRLVRILPTYGIVIFATLLISGNFSWGVFLQEWSCVGYWSGGHYYDWYIPNQMLLYLLFPFFYFIINRWRTVSLILLSISCVIICFITKDINFMAVCRYPVFVMGIFWGIAMLKDEILQQWIRLFFFLSLFGLMLSIGVHFFYTNQELIDNGWLFKPQMFMVVGFCYMLVWLFLRYQRLGVLKLFGSMSLEVYILHGRFIDLAEYTSAHLGANKYLLGGALLLVSFFVAYGLHIVMSRLSSKLLASISIH